jgi:hypothetical protein
MQPLPHTFNPALSIDRLELVASWLLEELYATEDDLVRGTDSPYGRGCTAFDRQKNRIISEFISRNHEWLDVKSGLSFAVVFTIGGVPCRFSNDNPSNPTKDAVLIANRHQQEFLEFVADNEPGQFCFIIDRGYDEASEPRVEFRGFTPSGSTACRWISNATVRVLRVIEPSTLPAPVALDKPKVGPKTSDENRTDVPAANDSSTTSQ